MPLLAAPHAGQVDAVEQHRQRGRVDLRRERVVLELRNAKPTGLEPLVEEDEATVVPGENFHPVTTARNEDEEVARVDVLAPAAVHDRPQPVDAVAHVDRLGCQQDPD